MGMLAKIRRMHIRDKLSIREIARRTNLSRNTVRKWLKEGQMSEPQYPKRQGKSLVDPYVDQINRWLVADSHKAKRDRRTAKAMYKMLKEQGYAGSYVRLVVRVRQLRQEILESPNRVAYVPLAFKHGEAFQFDWSCEYAWVGGLRRRLEVAHCKLASSRAFWLTAYPMQSHEMLFDAHTRAFTAFGGVPRRGIYDNMKTAVDKVGRGKERQVNARFEAMCGHYLFEPEFCTVAAGWEKGIVEKNVQDRRRQIWLEVNERRWPSLVELNEFLGQSCRRHWEETFHPQWPQMTIADVLQDEQQQLMPMPKPFDGYVEHPVRVSPTSLIHFQRNRYSVPTPYAHQVVSLHVYPEKLVVVADETVIAVHDRQFERHQTCYEWQHYIPLIGHKPGALRNGAPFATMPKPLLDLQRHLLRHAGGDRAMAQILSTIPIQGLETVLVAVELALESGRPSGEHVMNILARLKSAPSQDNILNPPVLISEEPAANVSRYERLRASDVEAKHVP